MTISCAFCIIKKGFMGFSQSLKRFVSAFFRVKRRSKLITRHSFKSSYILPNFTEKPTYIDTCWWCDPISQMYINFTLPPVAQESKQQDLILNRKPMCSSSLTGNESYVLAPYSILYVSHIGGYEEKNVM